MAHAVMNSSSEVPLTTQFIEHVPALRRRAKALCRCSADAEDLVQDTLLRAFVFQARFEPGTHLRAWLMQVLYHVFVSRHRSRRRERLAFERYAHEPRQDAQAPVVECVTELPDSIKRALGVLPDSMAEVVRLVDIDELSYREAAESLRVPVGTVMSRLFRGRQRLAVQLSESSFALPRHGVAAA
jgi:RNA polymerase sigma-70 factor (ECF subfamily)